ncbi:uncharacterized protein LOC131938201 [Physella acuta]|uniref:uncharacterized protein LOC131938201 n=1 Tax=Physella acuta TaxID=109671 RepID=UPI0027DC6E86|nr:uncharacterized protein LOC131938201 [Physella acuta]
MASIKRVCHKFQHTMRTVNSFRPSCCHMIPFSDCKIKSANQFLKNCRSINTHSRLYSTFESSQNILSQSTMFVQDGINIEELPVLIRRVTHSSFPSSTYCYSGEKIMDESEFDNSFRQVLQSCTSVNDVFKLLEVPSDKVRGYSAAFALQRLHVLKYLNSDWNQIHSFIRSAVMRELYDTVEKDVSLLSNGTLISLVECYLSADGFSSSCFNAINSAIQCRLGDGTFSIEELLTLSNVLKMGTDNNRKPSPVIVKPKSLSMSIVSENSSRFLTSDDNEPSKTEHFDKYCASASPQFKEKIKTHCSEILNNLWVHLFSRYSELNAETLPPTLQALTSSNKYLILILQKPLSSFWANLSAENVDICLKALIRLRVHNKAFLTYLARWSYVNIHLMTPSLMMSFVHTFLHFGFFDENFIKVMERCLQLKGLQADTNVVAMCVEYCRTTKYLSPIVMDTAADHFTQHGMSYEPLQLFAVLRVFGHLNYLPTNSAAFLKQTEACLWERFDHIDEELLLEILGSFTFVNVLPKNFSSRLASAEFFSKLAALKTVQKINAFMWLRILKNAIVVDSANDVTNNLRWLFSGRSKGNSLLYNDNIRGIVYTLKRSLDYVLGPDYYYSIPFHCCYALNIDKDGLPIEVKRTNKGFVETQLNAGNRIAVIVRSADHFIVNTKQLLGSQVQRLKQLQLLGFTPVEIRVSEIAFAKRSDEYLGHVLKQHLCKYIDFDAVERLHCDPKERALPIPSEDFYNDWLGYSEADLNVEEETKDLDLIALLLQTSKNTLPEETDPSKKT